MSWDVIFYNVPANISDPEKYYQQALPLLGTKSDVISQLKKVFPDIKFSDPDWGYIQRPNFSIEFNFGKEDPLDFLGLRVLGNEAANEVVIAGIQAICVSTSWRAYDTTTGLFIDFDNDPARGYRIWREYHDRVTSAIEVHGEEVLHKSIFSFETKKKKPWWQFWKK